MSSIRKGSIMYALRAITAIITLFAAALLAGGCQSQELAACKKENADLAKKVFSLEAHLADAKDDMENAGVVMGNVFIDLEAKEKRIAELEKANADLKKEVEDLNAKLSAFSDSSRRLIQGVEEIRRVQREAAAKLKTQQTAADANAAR